MALEPDPMLEQVWNEAFTWSKELLHQLGKPHGNLGKVDVKDINKLNKPAVSDIAFRSIYYVENLMDYVKHLKDANTLLRGKLISSQEQVINVQEELAACKTEQIEVLKTTVTNSVKEEFKSYSSVVKQTLPKEPSLNPATLQTVVKRVMDEEDRSRNLVIFGLAEEDGEQITETVAEVFEALGEKPTVEACRIGRKKSKTDAASRPVKVTVSSSLMVSQILIKARKLRLTDKFKSVFVSPDRSMEQRETHRNLVKELKEKASSNPSKRFYIKGGEICSYEK